MASMQNVYENQEIECSIKYRLYFRYTIYSKQVYNYKKKKQVIFNYNTYTHNNNIIMLKEISI